MDAIVLHFAVQLFAALLLGAAVGLERQWRQRMAGTRTNALVAAGASAFVMAGALLGRDAGSRMASYVVSDVHFSWPRSVFLAPGHSVFAPSSRWNDDLATRFLGSRQIAESLMESWSNPLCSRLCDPVA